MLASQWSRVQEIFLAVADLPLSAQRQAVEQHCAADTELIEEVLSLLAEDLKTISMLDQGLTELAGAALAHGPHEAPVSGNIGPYRLIRKLGEGGMGVVYLAERCDIGGQVAIKLLQHAGMSPLRRHRFTQEQSLLARLNHSHIARIYDASTLTDGTPWFAMEYVKGVVFSDWLTAGPRDLRRDLAIFVQVCEAVRYAHGLAIIHRDLKPNNILVSEEHGAKLLDFGIAKQLIETQDPSLTIEGMQAMTPAYAAPEQITGNSVGVFTDVYALGVLLYEMLTGSLPPPARERKPDVSIPLPSVQAASHPGTARYQLSRREWADLNAVCLMALEIEPERRYLSADALVGDLRAFLDGQPLMAHAPGFFYQSAKFVRRNRGIVVSVAVSLTLLCAAGAIFTLRLDRAKNEALAQVARTERLQRFTESLFNGGQEAGRPQNLTTADLLRRGVLEAEGLDNDARMQADMFSTLGVAYQASGELDKADTLLQRAREKRRQYGGQRDGQYTESLVALGLLRRDEGRLDEAEVLLREAVRLDRSVKKSAHLGRSLWALSSVMTTHGKYAESRLVIEEAIRLDQPPLGNAKQYANDLSALADVHFYLEEYPAAEVLDQQVLTIYRKEYGENDPRVGDVLETLGQIALNQGQYKDSDSYLRRSLKIVEGYYGPNHSQVADILVSLAKTIVDGDRRKEAYDLISRALPIQIRVYGAHHQKVALTLNLRGTLEFADDDYDDAERDFRQAQSIWRETYGETHQFIGVCYANLAGIMLHRKQYAEAEQMVLKALEVYRISLPADNVNSAVAHVKLGRILMHEQRYQDAEAESLQGYRYFATRSTNYPAYLAGARKDLAEDEAHLGRSETPDQLLAKTTQR